jgi:hypothetical protein
MDVSGRILRTWMPAIHAGMTALSICILCRRAQAHESLLNKFSIFLLCALRVLRGEISLLSHQFSILLKPRSIARNSKPEALLLLTAFA